MTAMNKKGIAMDEQKVRGQLVDAYRSILEQVEIKLPEDAFSGLADTFLLDVTAEYCRSDIRIMVVGQEPKAWNGAYKGYSAIPDLSEYLQASMRKYSDCLHKKPKKAGFLRFLHHAGIYMQKKEAVSVIWGNLFAVSYKKASPIKSKAFPAIKLLSFRLLREQIRILQPNAVIFTTGWKYDKYLKECFEGDITNSNVIEPKKLWCFELPGVSCFRTSHPRYVGHNRWRKQALDLIINKMRLTNSDLTPVSTPQSLALVQNDR